MQKYDFCPNCFMSLKNGTFCSTCSYDYSNARTFPGALPPFTMLNNRYLLGRVLGKGGFGITYVAKDNQSNRICAVKEYMPTEYSSRDSTVLSVYPFNDKKSKYVFEHGREKFIEEALVLKTLLKDPIVVDYWDHFKQNNTAYMVMEFLDGQDLRKIARGNGGKLDPEVAKMIFVTVASSLMELHKKGILHRDLSPENIIFTRKDTVKIIDFGAARNFVSNQNKGMSILLKPGFAPPEQYETKGNQGPWTDVYALCATFYNVVSGIQLVDALFRYRGQHQPSLYELGCSVSKKTSDVIEKGMELDYSRRYKDFKELLDDIDIVSHPAPPPITKPPVEPSKFDWREEGEGPSADIEGVKRSHFGLGGHRRSRFRGYSREGYNRYAPNNDVKEIGNNENLHKGQAYVALISGNSLYNKIYFSMTGSITIGRSVQSCKLIINGDSNISREHCKVRYDSGRSKFYLTDVSTNNTYFENGSQLPKHTEIEVEAGTKFYLATKNHMVVVGIE